MSTELTAFVRHIERFSRSEIPIYGSQNEDTAVRKTKIRAQAIAKRYAFQSNAEIIHNYQNMCKCKLAYLFTRFGTFTNSCVTLFMNFLQSFQKFILHSFLFLYSQI